MTERTKKIYLVIDPNDKEVYWREFAHNHGFAILEGQYIDSESYLLQDSYYKNAQLRTLLNLFAKNQIRNHDVFVFTNAWNFVSIPLLLLSQEFKIDIKTIGIWNNSLFNPQSPMARRLTNKKQWGRNFEVTLFENYDLNCFLSEKHKLRFFNRNYNNKVDWPAEIVNYPFEHLKTVIDVEKEDIVFSPYPVLDEHESVLFKGLGFDINFQVVDGSKMHRGEYLNLLRKSKFIFIPKYLAHEPLLVYEAMLNGVVPIFLHQPLIKDYFYPEFYFQIKTQEKFLNRRLELIRNRISVIDFIQKKIDNYDYWKQYVKDVALKSTEYLNKPMLTLL